MSKSVNGQSGTVLLIHGADEFRVETAAREAIRQILPADQQAGGLEKIDGAAATIADALAALRKCRAAIRTADLFNDLKLVWLRQASFLAQNNVGKSREVKDAVSDLATTIGQGLPAAYALIITAPDVDERTELFKACGRSGKVMAFNLPKPWSRDKLALQTAQEAFQNCQLRAASETIKAFIEKVGTDKRQIWQETGKLAVYLGERKNVEAADVEAIVSASRESFLWQIEDTAGNRDLAGSLRILRRLLNQKDDKQPIVIVNILDSHFRNLLVFKEALENRWLVPSRDGNYSRPGKGAMPADVEQLLSRALTSEKGPLSPFTQAKLVRQAAAISRQELEQCRQLILEARRKLVSSNVDPIVVLDTLIIKICKRTRQPQKAAAGCPSRKD